VAAASRMQSTILSLSFSSSFLSPGGSCVSHAINNGTSHHHDIPNCQWCSTLKKCVSPLQVPATGCASEQCIQSPDGGDHTHCSQTAGWPDVTCSGWVPPPPPKPPSPKIWNDGVCSCADYCDYKCANSVEGAVMTRQNVSLRVCECVCVWGGGQALRLQKRGVLCHAVASACSPPTPLVGSLDPPTPPSPLTTFLNLHKNRSR
jgi:hypothetical protein